MPNYRYEAIGSNDEVVSGEITAARVSDAISQLEAQGLQIELIRAIVAVPDLSLTKKAFYDRIDKALECRESLIAFDHYRNFSKRTGIAFCFGQGRIVLIVCCNCSYSCWLTTS